MTSCRHTRRDLPGTSYNALMAGKELMSRRNDLLERGGARRHGGGRGDVTLTWNSLKELSLGGCTSELRRCVKVEAAVLGTPSLIVLTFSVDVKQYLKKKDSSKEVNWCFTPSQPGAVISGRRKGSKKKKELKVTNILIMWSLLRSDFFITQLLFSVWAKNRIRRRWGGECWAGVGGRCTQ